MPLGDRSPKQAKIAAVLAVVLLLVVSHQLGILQRFAEPAELKRTLVELGPWGYVAFIAAYTLLQPFGIPGTVFVWAAALIWPWPVAFALSMVGTLGASVVGFSFARFVARDWIAMRIPARFKKYDEALAKRAFLTVFTLRIIFWMPPLLHAFFGVSKVRFSTHFWGSFAGYLLPLFLVSFFGERLFEAAKAVSVETWVGVGFAVLTTVLVVWLHRRRATNATGA